MSKRKHSHGDPQGGNTDILSFMMRAQRRSTASQQHPSISQSLIDFYEGTSTDFRGRSLSEILAWDDTQLERCHDFVQILFPLPEGSIFNSNAPLIDRHVFQTFRERTDLRENLLKAFILMLKFYGLEREADGDSAVKITKGANYNQRAALSWNKSMDHNHQRISRILRSLRLLGLEEEAVEFYNALAALSTRVAPRTHEFWRKAAFRSLNLAPNARVADEQDDTVGPEFLRDFVRQEKQKETKDITGKNELETTNEGVTGT